MKLLFCLALTELNSLSSLSWGEQDKTYIKCIITALCSTSEGQPLSARSSCHLKPKAIPLKCLLQKTGNLFAILTTDQTFQKMSLLSKHKDNLVGKALDWNSDLKSQLPEWLYMTLASHAESNINKNA